MSNLLSFSESGGSIKEKALKLSAEQREISVSEFFEKNKHLLGYSNLNRALLTVVREAVDNALDACEAADILPNISVEMEEVDKEANIYKVVVEDNGPGIKKENVPNVFGKLLFGSKFMKLSQSRGQQGIGISGAVLYSYLTTGKPAKIYSKIGDGKVHVFELTISINNNTPQVLYYKELEGEGHGIRIELLVKGKYNRGRQSIYEYLKQTAIMNPHAQIVFTEPSGEKHVFKRAIERMPQKAKEIKPHPEGIELGMFMRMLQTTNAKRVSSFLVNEFSRMSKEKAYEILAAANIDPKRKPQDLTREEGERLLKEMQRAKLKAPPTDCLSPVGEKEIIEGLKKELLPEFTAAVSRSPRVYRGFPFLVEVGLAYGGNIDQQQGRLLRYANKVPLLYEQGACALTKAFLEIDWKRYGLKKGNNGFPEAPIILSIHFASVWVPYTSESKEAIANYDEIIKEIKLAIQDVARRLYSYLSKINKAKKSKERESKFVRYKEEIAKAIALLAEVDEKEVEEEIEKLLKKYIRDYSQEIEALQDEDYRRLKKMGDLSRREIPPSDENVRDEVKNKEEKGVNTGGLEKEIEDEIEGILKELRMRKGEGNE